MDTKPCAVCGKPFERNPKYSGAQWEKASYCSNYCRGRTLAMERAMCACGCGERVAKLGSTYRPNHAPYSDARRKLVKFDGRRFYIHDRQGRKVYWARVVMMGELGRLLRHGEVVHHLNGDKLDDRPENLALHKSHADHMKHEWAVGNIKGRGSIHGSTTS